MSQTTTQKEFAREQIETAVLDAVQKGFTKVSDLISYCGPGMVRTNTGGLERELDVPQMMRAIERLIRAGYLEQEGQRLAGQLHVHLTERGSTAAPDLSERERELLAEYEVSPVAIEILGAVLRLQDRHESLPSIGDIRQEIETDLITYQVTPVNNQLVKAGLATEQGLFRYRIDPTDTGRAAVEGFPEFVR